MINACKLFADDSKLIAIVRSTFDLKIVQEDIDQIVNWASSWHMKFNNGKCKYMHFGSTRPITMQFTMSSSGQSRHIIEQSTVERDLGVMVNSRMKCDDHIDKVVQTANGVLCSLKNAFKYWTTDNFKKLYSAFVRPHLEFCTAAWNPTQKKDIKRLEKVQRRATKLVPHLKNLNYKERLAAIGLTTLEERRVRGDIIQMYKINSKINQVRLHALVESSTTIDTALPSSNLRRKRDRLTRQFCTVAPRENFFTNRVSALWNELPENVINAASVNVFKSKFDKFRLQQQLSSNTTIAE